MKEYRHGNVVLKIYRPELSDSERAKREQQILNTLQQYGKAMVAAEKCEVI